MNDLIDLLREMGATEVRYLIRDDNDDLLIFKYQGRVATINGVPYNNSTGGIDAEVVKET